MFDTYNGSVVKPLLIRNFEQLDTILGLAYTSTGMFAGYSICNVEIYLDANRLFAIHHIAMDKYKHIYAVCSDIEEREIIINIC
jgi:hypothetical protein